MSIHYCVSPIHFPLSIWAPSHPRGLTPFVQNPGLTSPNLPTDKTCALLCYYAACNANILPTFRDNIASPFSRVMHPKKKILVPCSRINNPLNMADVFFFVGSWSLKMGPTDRPQTSVINYHYSLRNNPEERSSRLPRSGRINSQYKDRPFVPCALKKSLRCFLCYFHLQALSTASFTDSAAAKRRTHALWVGPARSQECPRLPPEYALTETRRTNAPLHKNWGSLYSEF
jgi:hypothetical protein